VSDVMLKSRVNGINWSTAVFMALFHIGAVAALFMFNWKALLVAILLWWVAGSLGVGIGFHRLLTHRSYKTPKLVEYFLTICGTLALEGGPIYWVVTHRIHHAHADAAGDPHTPRDGGWWSHMGWILSGTAQQYDSSVVAHYAPDLIKDRFHIWLNRLYWLPLVLVGLALLAFGGWSYLMWGIFFRATFNLHATCSPNRRAPWTCLVRNRHQLVGNSRDAVFGTRESDQIGQSGSAFFGMMEDAGPKRERKTFQ
jgi:fatty-acid desaturase